MKNQIPINYVENTKPFGFVQHFLNYRSLTFTSPIINLTHMLPQWIIEKKRDGQALTPEEISSFLNGYLRNDVPDYQMSALAMAIFFQDMTAAETAAFTEGMLTDSIRISHDNLSAPKIDKHSTGGVGDKVSLILAPLAATCGLVVPMIAGRGLGATGGTIDKLESIPGYRTDLSEDEFKKVLSKTGCSIIGQSKQIAPVDRRLYTLRDVTGTVPAPSLIVASILSKKLAAGLEGLVLDVKWGRGAFMREIDQARNLARRLIVTARKLGLPCSGLLTDMNQPLGRTAGNAPEVVEAIDVLRGRGPADTLEVTLAL
ncbi:MAG: thymidine phosphorylase, partial [Lentisphaerae bacterium]|nr:thymidine phosphorylase [Lentisphaerota bacterium]